MKRKLTDKSEVERQIKEEVLATQKGLEKVFREMNQLKKNEQKAQEKLEEIRDARDQWMTQYLDKSSEVVRLEISETELKEDNKGLSDRNKMLTKELTDTREEEEKLKLELSDITKQYNDNRYEIEVLYGSNSSAEEAATERIEEMKIDFQTNIEEIHEDYIMKIESAKIKSDKEANKLKTDIRKKENEIGSKVSDALKERTQEKKTNEEKQNDALRLALRNLTRKPRKIAIRPDEKEMEELANKSGDLREIKELISRTNLASATDNDGWLFLLTLEYSNKLNEKTDEVNRLARKNNRLNAKLSKIKEVNDSRIKELEERLAKCINQLKIHKLKMLNTKVRKLEDTNQN